MQKAIVQLPTMQFAGYSFRTRNGIEQEVAIDKIGSTISLYHQNNWGEVLSDRKREGRTYCIHTIKKYESEKYHYFIGEEVEIFSQQPHKLNCAWVLPQDYIKFTSEAGPLQDIRVDMWEKINKMTPEDFGSERLYIADFEVFDERAKEPHNAIIDIYIGVMDKSLYLARKSNASDK